MKSFLSEYMGRWALSFGLTFLIALAFQIIESSFLWIMAIGFSAIMAVGILAEREIQRLKVHYLKNLIPEDKYLVWWSGLSMGIVIIMWGMYMNFTSMGFSMALGLLSGCATFLFLIILFYEKD